MAKILNITIVLMLLCSCSGRNTFEGEKYDMVFLYNPWLKIDFETKVLNIDYQELKYTDTIRLSKEDETSIINSFYRNKINEVKGKALYADGYRIMPPSDLTIQLFDTGKLQTEIIIDSDCKEKGYWPFSKRYRVLSFRDDVLRVLNKNKDFKKALNTFIKYNSKLWKEQMR